MSLPRLHLKLNDFWHFTLRSWRLFCVEKRLAAMAVRCCVREETVTSWFDWRMAFAWSMAVAVASAIFLFPITRLVAISSPKRIRFTHLSHFGAGEYLRLTWRGWRHFRQKFLNTVGAAQCSKACAGNRHKRMPQTELMARGSLRRVPGGPGKSHPWSS